ncbi:rfrA family pentapeptide repeat [Crocosphaera subtropica ATCC 51142]|uniref:RfrA family pentapeptide repeat n=1 Tax=Crocosphaera subtropica (strain ATCC 51142 / BH68) TaxID=43989 RepID=B1X010_CROS5|nr:pentapeptide repeat-containing protein [Crocosphaera subtropica]ACB52909.1 rfrA family pentapeptide repeat [Crocosphaera subtropica ATCC 51142]
MSVNAFDFTNLKKSNLCNANLPGADLRDLNLEGANLQGANLQGAYLTNASLRNAILNEANLEKSHLNKVNFEQARLRAVNLQNSYLNQANLRKAILDNSNFRGAYLTGAYLGGASLKKVDLRDACLVGIDLTNTNLEGSVYNECTKFPSDFNPVHSAMIKAKDITVKELLPYLTHLYQLGCQYLGSTLATKYWETSCPNSQWFNQFALESNNKIIFLGDLNKPITLSQQQYSQEWAHNFIKACSGIVRDFPTLVDPMLILGKKTEISSTVAK